MANDAAWQAGIDLGKTSKYNRKNKRSGDKGNDASTASAAKGAAGGGGNPWSILSYLPKLHGGGKVRKTGAYRLKRGETVVTAKQMKTLRGKKSTRKRVACKG